MRALVGVVAVCLVAVAFAGQVEGLALSASPEGATLLVGFEPGTQASASASIALSGGVVRRWIPEIGVAVVDAPDAELFTRIALLSSAIDFVETDDATRMAGGQWNSAEWQGAQWNGAQWNGAQWNGAQWNGAQWNGVQENGARANGAQGNGAQWNGAQWNAKDWDSAQRKALRWTIEHVDRSYTYDVSTSDPGLVWSWGAWATRAPEAWRTSTAGADLCVLDSGVDRDHPDIAPNFAASWNAIDPAKSGDDDAGHGTHVAGVAAAAVGNAFGTAGVSNARIHAAKVLDANGQGTESDLALGLIWCARQGVDVAVMALSADATSPTLDRAIAFAAQRDVLLLASAGNGGGAVEYPASDPRVLAVGAVGGDLLIAPFSARGPGVDLVAPGVHIIGPFDGGGFAFGSGTSQSVAVAAGAAALVRGHAPALTAAEAKDALVRSARDLGPPGVDLVYGAGLVDASRALLAAGGATA